MAELETSAEIEMGREPKAKDKSARRAETKTTPAAPKRAKGFWCYIGPNIKGLTQSGSVYRGSREDALRALADAVKKEPAVKTLLVSGEQLAAARRKLRQPGNALYEAYRKIKNGR